MTPEEAVEKLLRIMNGDEEWEMPQLDEPESIFLDEMRDEQATAKESIEGILTQVAATAKHDALIEVAEMWEETSKTAKEKFDVPECAKVYWMFANLLRTLAEACERSRREAKT